MSNAKQLTKPSKVVTAVYLLYASLGLGIIRSIINLPRHFEASSVNIDIFILFAVFGLTWILIYMTGEGRGWARITFLVLFILGAPYSVFLMIQSVTHNPASSALGLVRLVMDVMALVLLFQGESSAWFKAIKQPRT